MRGLATAFLSALPAATALVVTRQEAQGSVVVNLGQTTGKAETIASGFIYGWPDNGTEVDTSIPDHLVTPLNIRASRAGGAQLSAPALGWAVGGYEGYKGRFESTLSNYRTTRKFGADFILLPHDLWGADGVTAGGKYPGDDGDWTEMEKFYDQLVSDLKENNMLEGLVFDIWNEPELNSFWGRSADQFFDYYVRAHKIVREKLPGTLISGTSGAEKPAVDSDFWNQWMERIVTDDAIPDIWSWHQIGAETPPDTTIKAFTALRERYSLPERPIDINEYAWPEEQNPSTSAWYIAQLERHNMRGLRANWGSGGGLHDTMADLIFHGDGGYEPNGEWYLYEYYAQMEGDRVATTASDDMLFDVFATVSTKGVKLLTGTQEVHARYEIKVNDLTSLGLPEEGSVHVRTLEFDWGGRSEDTGSPKDLGVVKAKYADDSLTILVDPPNNTTAYAYEILTKCK